jgi:hypothetical protein
MSMQMGPFSSLAGIASPIASAMLGCWLLSGAACNATRAPSEHSLPVSTPAGAGMPVMSSAAGSGAGDPARPPQALANNGGSAATPALANQPPTAASAAGRAGSAEPIAGQSAPDQAGSGGAGATQPATPAYHDPGEGPWEQVPKSDVLSVCKLDPDKLAAAERATTFPWLIIRYGKLCWAHNALDFAPAEAWSTTKTMGALVTGLVAFQTKDIPRSGPKTGPFSDEDRVDAWISGFPYNKEAHVGHVLGMVAHNSNLEYGSRTMIYDTVGSNQINTLSDMLNAAIAQDKARLGDDLEAFTKRFLYKPLGMTKSVWTNGSATKVFAYTWNTDLMDMARVGLLILHRGMWSGTRLVDDAWIEKMTRPSFEDANTGFGYLTWLNSASNHNTGGLTGAVGSKIQGADTPGPCAPLALHPQYPHGTLSGAKDCNYSPPYSCEQKFDVGIWGAEGYQGQCIQGHRALDMVLVARNVLPGQAGPGTAKAVWDALRPAVIAGDPMYKGDETAFCKAYGSNSYAPDLQ